MKFCLADLFARKQGPHRSDILRGKAPEFQKLADAAQKKIEAERKARLDQTVVVETSSRSSTIKSPETIFQAQRTREALAKRQAETFQKRLRSIDGEWEMISWSRISWCSTPARVLTGVVETPILRSRWPYMGVPFCLAWLLFTLVFEADTWAGAFCRTDAGWPIWPTDLGMITCYHWIVAVSQCKQLDAIYNYVRVSHAKIPISMPFYYNNKMLFTIFTMFSKNIKISNNIK